MRRLGRIAATLCAVLYLLVIATYLANRPSYAWDTIAYVAVALHMEGTPTDRLHDDTYDLIRHALPPAWVDNLTGNLTPAAVAVSEATTAMAQIDLRQDWAAHSDSFLSQLPFFSVKPLYPALMALGNELGVNLLTSGLIVSAISYVFIGLLFYLWFLEWMPAFIAFVTMALLILNPYLVTQARTIGPDIFSVALLLWGAYFAMQRRPLLSMLIFLISIPARPENIVYVVVFLLYIGLMRQTSAWWQVVVALFIAIGIDVIITTISGNYGWKTLFYTTFVNRSAVPVTSPHIGWSDIAMMYLGRLDRILLGQGELPIFALVGWGALCLKIVSQWPLNRAAIGVLLSDKYLQLAILAAFAGAARILIVPTEAFRALLPCYMLLCIVLVNACATNVTLRQS